MISIKVDPKDLARIMAAIDRVSAIVAALAKTIPEESAREFADILRNNITTQKYGDFGHPHGKWKKGLANEGAYWLWLGTVLKSIQPWNVQSTAQVIKWFVGLKYTGGTSVSSGKKRATTKKTTVKKEKKLTAAQQKTKKALQESRTNSAVRRVDISGYRPQEKRNAGTLFGGGKSFTFGKEPIKKRMLSDTSADTGTD
jgi:hypothetical protein